MTCSDCKREIETTEVVSLEKAFPTICFDEYKDGQLCSDCASMLILQALYK
jgi:hypothetical protein